MIPPVDPVHPVTRFPHRESGSLEVDEPLEPVRGTQERDPEGKQDGLGVVLDTTG